MKNKNLLKISIVLFTIGVLGSCSNDVDTLGIEQKSDIAKSAGDGQYDVLGYGYDITKENLNPTSVRAPVIDITKYEKAHKGRLLAEKASWGYDQFYYGYSSTDYTRNMVKELNIDAGVSDTTGLFSANFSSNPYFNSLESYSTKYSFASIDALRNRKIIYINDDNIPRLSSFLSDEFIEDLNNLSPNRLVERYGTHVLTNFIIGGHYKLLLV